jgi:hypothetical protein
MKNKAVAYHLYHPIGYTIDDHHNMANIMRQKIKMGRTYCLNGINKQKIS